MTLDMHIEQALTRVEHGVPRCGDAELLRRYIVRLQQQTADAQDKARRVRVVDLDDLPHTCGYCGKPMTHVRPGKWQCNHCEAMEHDA